MKLVFTLCKAVHQSFHAVGSFLFTIRLMLYAYMDVQCVALFGELIGNFSDVSQQVGVLTNQASLLDAT